MTTPEYTGRVCPNCGMWHSGGHTCPALMQTKTVTTWDRTSEIIMLLERIAAALERLAPAE